jgi:hypothetical protein
MMALRRRTLRPGQRFIPGVGLIRGGAATKRTGPWRPPKPEHQELAGHVPADEAPPLDRAAALETIRKFREKQGWGPRQDEPAPGPDRRLTPAEIEAKKAVLLAQALQLGTHGQCARCGQVVPRVSLVPVDAAWWCPPCRAARDAEQLEPRRPTPQEAP